MDGVDGVDRQGARQGLKVQVVSAATVAQLGAHQDQQAQAELVDGVDGVDRQGGRQGPLEQAALAVGVD